ncbi:MAG: SRPBCC family protein [Deltaproteobacteria bacterium]|nr:SRPBCC family protein [Deltaproteobacteria bacterium]
MLKKILIVVAVLVAGFLVFVSTRPDSYHVERSTSIAAPAAVIFAQLDNFKAWPAWSPWEKRDPQMKKTFEGPPSGVGSSYSWQGNKDVGQGKMTILVSEPPNHIRYQLEFIEPFVSTAATGFTLASQGDKTNITWGMDGTNNFVSKIFGVFMNMDQMIGADFESGLAGLKAVAEAEAAKRAAAEAQAAASAATQAAKTAADAQVTADAAAAVAAASKEIAKKKR